jgi:hypothetical protein
MPSSQDWEEQNKGIHGERARESKKRSKQIKD